MDTKLGSGRTNHVRDGTVKAMETDTVQLILSNFVKLKFVLFLGHCLNKCLYRMGMKELLASKFWVRKWWQPLLNLVAVGSQPPPGILAEVDMPATQLVGHRRIDRQFKHPTHLSYLNFNTPMATRWRSSKRRIW